MFVMKSTYVGQFMHFDLIVGFWNPTQTPKKNVVPISFVTVPLLLISNCSIRLKRTAKGNYMNT